MHRLQQVNWQNLLSGNHQWVNQHLKQYPPIKTDKSVTRVIGVEFSGTEQELNALVDSIADSIVHYVYDKKQIEIFRNQGIEPFRKASRYFGKTNPDMDGKYGELLLYILTESILETPLVSHKLTLLTNPNDQVKGGDGIFFGKYEDDYSILIGESKIHQQLSKALESSFDSLDRFHKNYTTDTLDHELFIARSNISSNFSNEQLDALFDAFTPGTDVYKNCTKAHPVLLVFNTKVIERIERKAKNKQEAEKLFEEWVIKRSEEIQKNIVKKLNKYKQLKKVYVDIFLIPLMCVSHFKNSLYKAIHNVDYVSTESQGD